MKRTLLAAVAGALLVGCPSKEEDTVRVGADQTLEELGLIEFVLAAFEEEHKVPTRLVYDDTDGLQKRAEAGELDYFFVVSEASIEALKKKSIPIRVETYAHEEFVAIGPWEDLLGRHKEGSTVDFMKSVARSNYRFLKGKKGSVEYARHRLIFEESGDRQEPGSYFDTDLQGVELVKRAIANRSFALVKRSSLLQAAEQGHLPHRVYREADPGLVLRMVIVEVHPAKTRSKRKPALFDFVTGEKGKALVSSFGERRFGYPVFGPGEPPEGEGARVPKLEEKKGLQQPAPEEETAKKQKK